MSYFLFINFIFILIISNSLCKRTEQIIVESGQPFSFDCQQDESVYFGHQIGEWSEIQNNDIYSDLNLKFDYLNQENILRVTSDSAQSQNTGYYGCRKSTSSKASMNRIYQLILADVQSFYWNYICHGPPGSCVRFDDITDETLSTFEVADQTKVDLHCCASVTGYKDVNLNMNKIGEIRGKIDVKRKQELDGSWVICANQHTLLKQTSSINQQTLKCELIIDKRTYSSLSSGIIMKDPVPDDGTDYPLTDGARGKLTRKQIAIIIGSIIAGLFLFGLLFSLIFFLCHKKKALKNSKPNQPHAYLGVNTNKKSNKIVEQNPKEEESTYLKPTPLYVNSSAFPRV